MAFSLDGKLVALASEDYTVRLWDSATGASLQTLEVHSGEVRASVISSDGQYLDTNIIATGWCSHIVNYVFLNKNQ